jgi:uncharacterized protein YukE
MTYDIVEKALNNNERVREDFRGQLANISSAINGMGASFKGKAGRAFMNYWEGTGNRHSDAVIRHLEILDEKLKKIQQLVEENDDACAALFNRG